MSSTIPTFPPLCPLPLTKGGAFKTLYKDGNKFKVFQEWVRDFDAMSYSKGETYKVSPFSYRGLSPTIFTFLPNPSFGKGGAYVGENTICLQAMPCKKEEKQIAVQFD